MGAVSTFDSAVEFGRARGQDEQTQATLLTGLLKLGTAILAASIRQPRMEDDHLFKPPMKDRVQSSLRRGVDQIPCSDMLGEFKEDYSTSQSQASAKSRGPI